MKLPTIPLAALLLVAPVLADQNVLVNVSIADDRQELKVTLENYDDSDQSCTVNIRALAGAGSQDVTTLLLAPHFDVPAHQVRSFQFGRDQLDRSIPGIGYRSAEARSQRCTRVSVSTFVKEIGIPGRSVSFWDLIEQPDGALITLTWQSGGCVGAGVSAQGFAVQKFDRTGHVIWRNELCNFSPEMGSNPPPARLLPSASGGVTLVTASKPSSKEWLNTFFYGLQKLEIDVQGHAGSAEVIAGVSTEFTNLYAMGEVGKFRVANSSAVCEGTSCFESTVYGTDGSRGPTVGLEYRIVAQDGLPDVPTLYLAKAAPLDDGSFLVYGTARDGAAGYLKRHAQDGALIWAREVKYPPGIGPPVNYSDITDATVRKDGQIQALLLGENLVSHQVTPMLFLLGPTDGRTVWIADFDFQLEKTGFSSAKFTKNDDVLLSGSAHNEAVLMRTDANANVLWTRAFPGSPEARLYFQDCQEARDGGIFCRGERGKKAILYKLTADGKEEQSQ